MTCTLRQAVRILWPWRSTHKACSLGRGGSCEGPKCAGIKCEVVETERRDHAKDILLNVASRRLGTLDGVILVTPCLQKPHAACTCSPPCCYVP